MKDLSAANKYMQYGFDGENNYRQITFDISDLISGYSSPSGSVMCYWQRPGDLAAYPCGDFTVDWAEGEAVLVLSGTETLVAGKCRCQLVYVGNDGTVGKDKIYGVNIPKSLTGGDAAEGETIPWVVEVLEAKEAAEQAADEAEASADLAEQYAQRSADAGGFAWFEVNRETGELIVTVTDKLAENVTFAVNKELGTLEVTVS